MMMRILDKDVVTELVRHRRKLGIDQKDEVWDGVYVIMPEPTIDHQRLVKRLTAILITVVDDEGLGEVFPGTNVSDRRRGWDKNFRAPAGSACTATTAPASPRSSRKSRAARAGS
jgi:hypothetical protein